jgi:AcrR family transcriptional regulator
MSRVTVLAAARDALADGQPRSMADLAATAGISVKTLYRMFGSRAALLKELEAEAPLAARERILESALELIGRDGLAEMSMDELAEASSVSRATLYRLFPGKSALFRELIQTFSPWEAVADVIEAAADPSPQAVIPEVGRALAAAMAGRTGLLLRIVVEMVKGEPDTAEGLSRSMGRGLPDLIRYLAQQMEAKRLRKMHPVLAFQLLAGPIVAHLLTRRLAMLIGFDQPVDKVVDQIVEAWLRGMSLEVATKGHERPLTRR